MQIVSCDLEQTFSPQRGSDGAVYGDRMELPAAFSHLRVDVERLRPGHLLSAPHAHSIREEAVMVLAGEVVAVEGEREVGAPAGTLVMLPPGGEAHTVCNRSEEDALLLVFSASESEDEVVYES